LKKKFKVGLFADGIWSHRLIELIKKNKNFEISFICKRFKTEDQKINTIAKKFRIKLYRYRNVNSKRSVSIIKKYNCDIFISMSYDQIFTNKILELAPKKFLNCHAGHLPKYRGRNVLNWALINGEKNFYITVHFVDENIDTGPIIERKKFKINFHDNYEKILKVAQKNCPIIIYRVLKKILYNKKIKVIYQPKNLKKNNYYRKRVAGDEFIEFNQDSLSIYNFIRGLAHPNLYAKVLFNKKIFKIHSSKIIKIKKKIKQLKAGTVLKIKKNYFDVKSNDNKIRLFYKKNNVNFKIGTCLIKKLS
tara:strand:- start:2089 stop:3003 length:915 start_codon:yes stop_codon:yes gene_type:complete